MLVNNAEIAAVIAMSRSNRRDLGSHYIAEDRCKADIKVFPGSLLYLNQRNYVNGYVVEFK